MKILNIMLSRDLGGIQQAFLDYNEALKLEQFEVINVTAINAKINKFLPFPSSLRGELSCPSSLRVEAQNRRGNLKNNKLRTIFIILYEIVTSKLTFLLTMTNYKTTLVSANNDGKSNETFHLPNIFPYDFISIIYLKYLIYKIKPDKIIAHGNRAIGFSKRAKFAHIPLIGVAHNYTLKGLKKCDKVIALTQHMKNYLCQNNFLAKNIIVLPNMMHIKKDFIDKTYKKPVVIGVMARLVAKKGVDLFLQSLAILKSQNYSFKAIIGGDGPEKDKLLELSKKLDLNKNVSFIGWVNSSDKFFEDIDIFCLPSLHEPFGIILLEAMEASLPIVATKTEGPQEILNDLQHGLLCEISPESLAQKIAYLIDNPEGAKNFAKLAYLKLKSNYNINIIAKRLSVNLF